MFYYHRCCWVTERWQAQSCEMDTCYRLIIRFDLTCVYRSLSPPGLPWAMTVHCMLVSSRDNAGGTAQRKDTRTLSKAMTSNQRFLASTHQSTGTKDNVQSLLYPPFYSTCCKSHLSSLSSSQRPRRLYQRLAFRAPLLLVFNRRMLTRLS